MRNDNGRVTKAPPHAEQQRQRDPKEATRTARDTTDLATARNELGHGEGVVALVQWRECVRLPREGDEDGGTRERVRKAMSSSW